MRVFKLILNFNPYSSLTTILKYISVVKSSARRLNLIVYCVEFFANLAESHGRVGENLVFGDLFLNYFRKDYLERKAESTFFQVLLKHLCLFLLLARVVIAHCFSPNILIIYLSDSP